MPNSFSYSTFYNYLTFIFNYSFPSFSGSEAHCFIGLFASYDLPGTRLILWQQQMMTSLPAQFCPELSEFESSAYMSISVSSRAIERSLIKTMKNKGPKIEP